MGHQLDQRPLDRAQALEEQVRGVFHPLAQDDAQSEVVREQPELLEVVQDAETLLGRDAGLEEQLVGADPLGALRAHDEPEDIQVALTHLVRKVGALEDRGRLGDRLDLQARGEDARRVLLASEEPGALEVRDGGLDLGLRVGRLRVDGRVHILVEEQLAGGHDDLVAL